MKIYYLLMLVLLVLSCQMDNDPEIDGTDQLDIVAAQEEQKVLFSGWMGSEEAINARLTPREFNPDDLLQIKRNGMTRWAVPKNGDPNTSLSFVFDEDRGIDMAF